MQPVYIQHTASVHPQGNPENHPYLSACEPDYKVIITNTTLRRRMSRIIKMGGPADWNVSPTSLPKRCKGSLRQQA